MKETTPMLSEYIITEPEQDTKLEKLVAASAIPLDQLSAAQSNPEFHLDRSVIIVPSTDSGL